MATAVSQGATGNAYIDGVLSGVKWSGTVTYSFPDSATDYPAGYGTGEQFNDFAQLSAQQQTAAHSVMQQIGNYTNLTITFAGTDGADIKMAHSDDANPTAYAYYPDNSLDGEGGDVWFGDGYTNPIVGNYQYATHIHELGHAFGLKHGHETGGPGNVAIPADHDALEYTVMTYRSYVGGPTTGGYTNEQFGYPQTFMMSDIAALQTMYGADYTYNSSDSVYKWTPGSGVTSINGVAAITPGGNRIFMTVWDGGGNDTYDFSAYSTGVTINLNPGEYSIGSQAQLAALGTGNFAHGNVYNAMLFQGDVRSYIENAIGGSGNDTIIGNNANNSLTGGLGADVLNGGGGTDIAWYFYAGSAVTVDLSTGLGQNGEAAGDTLSGIEIVIGSASGDTLIGDGNANTLDGEAGNDVLQGGGGNDTLYGVSGNDWLTGGLGADQLIGGDGTDIAWYFYAGSAVTVDLSTGLGQNGEAAGDTLSGIEIVIGSASGDTLIGDGNANTLDGEAGNDVLQGGGGNDTLYGVGGDDTLSGGTEDDWLTGGLGADQLIGGDGTDIAWYFYAGSAVTVDLSTGLGQNGEAAGDTLSGIEIVIGSASGDTLIGDGNANTLDGQAGNDVLQGGGGNDRLSGGAGDDTLSGGTEDDWLTGGLGADQLIGGDGTDIAWYFYAGSAVTVDLSTGLGQNGEAAGDTLSGLEIVIGSAFADTLIGDGNANILDGQAGNDSLRGNGGVDSLYGGAGDDTFIFDLATANGDTIGDFSGNGAAAGDQLRFIGYGTAAQGATFTQIDATHWSINSFDGAVHDILTVANGASIHASDYLFV